MESNVVNWNRAKPFSWKVQFSKDATATMEKSTFKGLGDSSFLLYAAQEGDLRITPETVTQGPYFASYEIRNHAGEVVNSGILNTGTPIIIPAKTGDFFVLNIPTRKPVNYKLAVQNATIADGSFDGQTLTLSGAPAAVYVYSPLRDVTNRLKPGENTLAIKVTSKPVGSSGIYKGVSLLTATKNKK